MVTEQISIGDWESTPAAVRDVLLLLEREPVRVHSWIGWNMFRKRPLKNMIAASNAIIRSRSSNI